MNAGGDAADQMVREGIQITESTVKLAGLGAKNLAALLIALAQDGQKLQGKTNTKRLLKEGKELTIFQIKQPDLARFNEAAQQYGVLFTVIVDKKRKDGCCDLMAKAEDAAKINRIFELLGYPAPVHTQASREDVAPKKAGPAPRGRNWREQRSGLTASGGRDTTNEAEKKPSVRSRIEAIKAAGKGEPETPTIPKSRSKNKPKER